MSKNARCYGFRLSDTSYPDSDYASGRPNAGPIILELPSQVKREGNQQYGTKAPYYGLPDQPRSAVCK